MDKKYTRYQFNKDIYQQWNSVRVVKGFNVAVIKWLNMPWRIVEIGKTFDEVADREYKPIAEFRVSEDLYNYIKNN